MMWPKIGEMNLPEIQRVASTWRPKSSCLKVIQISSKRARAEVAVGWVGLSKSFMESKRCPRSGITSSIHWTDSRLPGASQMRFNQVLTRRLISSAAARRQTSCLKALSSSVGLWDWSAGSFAVSKSIKAYLRSIPRRPARRGLGFEGTITSINMFCRTMSPCAILCSWRKTTALRVQQRTDLAE